MTERALAAAAEQTWDAIVVGAGPAGATAGAILARRGWRVLLLERSAWPRRKVCGGCLNATAVEILRQAGLGAALRSAVPLERVRVRIGHRVADVSTPGGAAIDRKTLDEQLVAVFIQRGGTFITGATASVQPQDGDTAMRSVNARCGSTTVSLRSRAVLACDGLAGTSVSDEPWAGWRVARHAWMGVAAPAAQLQLDLPHGTIEMNVGERGYVGLTRYDDASIHLAAALDPSACRELGGPAALIERILRGCGYAINADQFGHLQGTPLLTRQRVGNGGHRVLVVGDACGYVEPFTGEGIAWALRGATEVSALLPDPSEAWPADLATKWAQRHHRTVHRQQYACRAVRYAARRPTVATAAVAMLKRWPALARLVNRPAESAPLDRPSYEKAVTA
ncbi:MAG TPA: FAD-dependent monooxygenase [Tepidisphaeraceae bacterium]|jgi:flavin-dependent dehydrogenase|nr:FAD-dependent monooxygenase [Tepidisphaeraceae bacterium]